MQLVYDQCDLEYAARRGDERLNWLIELGAIPIHELSPENEGFLFGYQISNEEFAALVERFPKLRDRSADRGQLARLDDVLKMLSNAGIVIATPRTWILTLDDPLPSDLTYPLFVRTSTSSWKRGGHVSKVRKERELEEECELLRRAFRWDATILAREWLELAPAGAWRYGEVPVEVRVWIVDAIPFAWSFHYLHAVPDPKGFPLSEADLVAITEQASRFAVPFSSRLIAADFVKDRKGNWHFLEAGPGACSGTAHKNVFTAVASKLMGEHVDLKSDAVGGLLPSNELGS